MSDEGRLSAWGIGLNTLAAAAFVGLWLLPPERAALRVPLFLGYGFLWVASMATGVVQVADGAARPRVVVHLLVILPGAGHAFGLLAHTVDLVGGASRAKKPA